MIGIIIYENDLGSINAVKLKHASFCCKSIEMDITDTLEGTPIICESANCDKSDTYDFETGALIALMKMCGVEKVKKAAKETFFDVAEKAVNEYEEEIKNLKKRINELENYNNQLEDRVAAEQRGGYKFLKDMEKLQHEYDLCRNSENALKITTQMQNKSIEKLTKAIDGYKQDLYKVSKRCGELEIKESTLNKQQEQLNKREEKLSVYFGGRGCGKQYKALVALFKKIDKKKVQEACKEAYGDEVIWHTSQPSIRDSLTVDSLIEQSRAFRQKCVHEWLYKIPTKREEMWENIINVSQDQPVDIKVAKQDVKVFLKELQDKIPEAKWNGSDCLPTEYTNPYWFKHDYIYFGLFRYIGKGNLKICYDESPHSWINKPVIEYIAPMRWDLFKKGRLAVKVNYDNYKEFYEACEKELGKKPSTIYAGEYTVSICKKDGLFQVFTVEHQKSTGHKIVNWEDVRENKTTMEDPYDTWSL